MSRHYFTGGGGPPPPRTDADTFARIYVSSLRCGRRRWLGMAAGADVAPKHLSTQELKHPEVLAQVWPQARRHPKHRWAPKHRSTQELKHPDQGAAPGPLL